MRSKLTEDETNLLRDYAAFNNVKRSAESAVKALAASAKKALVRLKLGAGEDVTVQMYDGSVCSLKLDASARKSYSCPAVLEKEHQIALLELELEALREAAAAEGRMKSVPAPRMVINYTVPAGGESVAVEIPGPESYVPKQWEPPFIQEDLWLMNDGDCATLSIGGDWPDDWEDSDVAFQQWDATRTLIEARTRAEWKTAYETARFLLRENHVTVILEAGQSGLSVKQLGRGKSITLLAE